MPLLIISEKRFPEPGINDPCGIGTVFQYSQRILKTGRLQELFVRRRQTHGRTYAAGRALLHQAEAADRFSSLEKIVRIPFRIDQKPVIIGRSQGKIRCLCLWTQHVEQVQLLAANHLTAV